MNMSKVYTYLRNILGLNQLALPFKEPGTDKPILVENVINTVITTITIPIYSMYQPWRREGSAFLRDLQQIDRYDHIYLLPSYLTDPPIIDVLDVHLPFTNTRGTFGDIAPAYGINRSVQGVATSQAYMMLAGTMRAEPTFEYKGENKVRLYGFPKVELIFEIKAQHLPNGETIDEGCFKSFTDLAILDMKEYLFNNLKYWDKIPTAHGELNLRIETWEGATAEKTAMLNQWDDTYHVDESPIIFM